MYFGTSCGLTLQTCGQVCYLLLRHYRQYLCYRSVILC